MKKPPKHKTKSKRQVAGAALPRSSVRVKIGRTAKAMAHILAPAQQVSRKAHTRGVTARELISAIVPEDRQLVGLLLAPFAIMTVGLGLSLGLKERLSLKELIAQRPPVSLRSVAPALAPLAWAATPAELGPAKVVSVVVAKYSAATVVAANPAAAQKSIALRQRAEFIGANRVALDVAEPSAVLRTQTLVTFEASKSTAVFAVPVMAIDGGSPGVVVEARLTPAPAMENLAISGFAAQISALDRVTAPSAARLSRCAVEDAAPAGHRGAVESASGKSFGAALARAALSQTSDLVIYNDSYRQISYPLGDVPALFGVCTDVVIRAYRALGVDLQALVHQARGRNSDASIDHRRVETLRRFFSAYGERIAVSDFAEDYSAGDIVTYNRPQNRHGQSHIAIVADSIGPSGHPMIVHNRGWGPQLEDALFVDEITGHYRYDPVVALPGGVANSANTGLEPSMPRGIARIKRAALTAKRITATTALRKASLESVP